MTSEESNMWLDIMLKNAIPEPEQLKAREELGEEIKACYININKGLFELLSNNDSTLFEDSIMCGGTPKYQTLFRNARFAATSRRKQKEFLIYLQGYLQGVEDWGHDNETKALREFITGEIFEAKQLTYDFENYNNYKERIERQKEYAEKAKNELTKQWNAYTPEEREKMIMNAVREIMLEKMKESDV